MKIKSMLFSLASGFVLFLSGTHIAEASLINITITSPEGTINIELTGDDGNSDGQWDSTEITSAAATWNPIMEPITVDGFTLTAPPDIVDVNTIIDLSDPSLTNIFIYEEGELNFTQITASSDIYNVGLDGSFTGATASTLTQKQIPEPGIIYLFSLLLVVWMFQISLRRKQHRDMLSESLVR